MREYLEYMIKIEQVDRNDMQKLLKISEKIIRNKLKGVTYFTWSEAKNKKHIFLNVDYDKLFEQTPKR